MVCHPNRTRASGSLSAFDFSDSPDATSRMIENVAVMWAAPWRAYWAFAFEAMDPQNYRN